MSTHVHELLGSESRHFLSCSAGHLAKDFAGKKEKNFLDLFVFIKSTKRNDPDASHLFPPRPRLPAEPTSSTLKSA